MKTIYYNGIIDTITNGIKEAFVVEDGQFIYVGDNKTAKEFYQENDVVIDLENKYVTAGFNDSHMHLLGYGFALSQIDLSLSTTSLQELLDAIKEVVIDKQYIGTWLRGRGWNQDYFEDQKRFPTRYDLDLVSKDIPIYITRACGHVCVVNSKALELANVTKDTKQIKGGHFDVDHQNEPLGIFRENAISLINNKISPPTKEEVKEMIKKACISLNKYGVTTCQTDDFTVFDCDYKEIIKAYQELEKEQLLTVKVYEQSQFKNIHSLKQYYQDTYKDFKASHYFNLGPLKLLGDGSLGARTAYLNEPYQDEQNNYGIAIYSEEELYTMMGFANKVGMQIAIHSIGDGIMDRILNVYERILKENPSTQHRHGIIHCQIMNQKQVKKMKELNLIAYIQSIFLDYDIQIVYDRVGKRADTSYCYKTLYQELRCLSNGSDAPVEKPSVVKGIQCAITRKTIRKQGPYLEKEALTLKEALASYTIKGAYASFEEDKKGSIEYNKVADFVILEENPYEVANEHIHLIKVWKTFVDGKCVYCK